MLIETMATEESLLSGSFVVILRERLTAGKSRKDNILQKVTRHHGDRRISGCKPA
jgi:hypothetical protein